MSYFHWLLNNRIMSIYRIMSICGIILKMICTELLFLNYLFDRLSVAGNLLPDLERFYVKIFGNEQFAR